ncbi:MAG: metalloregulator ArsR/SmtB family transcription factor [Candidatus Eisenbacteria bacterium]
MDLREIFEALGDPLRFQLLEELRRGPKYVTELVEATGAAQPNVSRGLKGLRDSGLIAGTREGKWIRYRVLPEALAEIRRWSGGRDRPPAGPEARIERGKRPGPDDYLFT